MNNLFTYYLMGVTRWSGLRESYTVHAKSLNEAVESVKVKADEVYETRVRTPYTGELNDPRT